MQTAHVNCQINRWKSSAFLDYGISVLFSVHLVCFLFCNNVLCSMFSHAKPTRCSCVLCMLDWGCLCVCTGFSWQIRGSDWSVRAREDESNVISSRDGFLYGCLFKAEISKGCLEDKPFLRTQDCSLLCFSAGFCNLQSIEMFIESAWVYQDSVIFLPFLSQPAACVYCCIFVGLASICPCVL